MGLNLDAFPFFDNSKQEIDKGFTKILFINDRAVQARELTGIASYSEAHIKEIANIVSYDGKIYEGCRVASVNITEAKISMTSGKIFLDGRIFKVPSITGLAIKTSGEEIIYAQITDSIVTEIEDPTLKDPSTGTENYDQPGAYRQKREIAYVSTASDTTIGTNGKLRAIIAKLYNGVVTWEAGNTLGTVVTDTQPSKDLNIMEVLAQRTSEESGDYLVNGFEVTNIDSEDNRTLGIQVSGGTAYIAGWRVQKEGDQQAFPKKNIYTLPIIGESINLVKGQTEYPLNYEYVTKIDQVMAPVKNRVMLENPGNNTVPVPTGYSIGSIDLVYKAIGPNPHDVASDREEYVVNVDYQRSDTGVTNIVWINQNHQPDGSYYVQYTYRRILIEGSDYILTHKKNTNNVTEEIEVPTSDVITLNQSLKNVLITKVENSLTGEILTENYDYYVEGNKISFLTKNTQKIKTLVKRNRLTTEDTLIYPTGLVSSVRYFSKTGSIILSNNVNFVASQGKLVWNSNIIPADEYYLAFVSVPTDKEITKVKVSYVYENEINSLDNTFTYDSFIKLLNPEVVNVDSGTLDISYQYAPNRIDAITLDSKGNLEYHYGIVKNKDGIIVASVPQNKMKLADIYIKPYATKAYINRVNNYRLRMVDLREVYNKVQDLQQNISLNELEKIAEASAKDSTKLRGIYVDNFTGISKMDQPLSIVEGGNELNVALPNLVKAQLYPNFKKSRFNLTINESLTTAFKTSDSGAYLLSSYASVPWIQQLKATKFRSLNEGNGTSSMWNPKIDITPDCDNFIGDAYESSLFDKDSTTFAGTEVTELRKVLNFTGTSDSIMRLTAIPFNLLDDGWNSIQFNFNPTLDNQTIFRFLNNDVLSNSEIFSIRIIDSYLGVYFNNNLLVGCPFIGLYNRDTAITVCLKNKVEPSLDKIKIYIDGQKQDLDIYNLNQNKAATTSFVPVTIGQNLITDSDFIGKLYNIRAWNKELTKEEIVETTNQKLVNKNETFTSLSFVPATTAKTLERYNPASATYKHNYTNGITVELKFRTTEAGTMILSHDNDNSIDRAGHCLMLVNGQVRFTIYGGTVGNKIRFDGYTSELYNDGNEHHVAATWDGTTTTNKVVVYIDGKKRIQGTSGATGATIGSGYTSPVMSRNQEGFIFVGELKQYRVWKSIRTEAQILANKDLIDITASPTELEVYYKCLDQDPLVLIDSSGNNRNAKLFNVSRNRSIKYPAIVGYWDCDDGEGFVISDSTIFSNHGIISSGVNWTEVSISSIVKKDGYKNPIIISNIVDYTLNTAKPADTASSSSTVKTQQTAQGSYAISTGTMYWTSGYTDTTNAASSSWYERDANIIQKTAAS